MATKARTSSKKKSGNGKKKGPDRLIDFAARPQCKVERIHGVDGFADDAPKPFSAVLRVVDESRRVRIYELPVISLSGCGLGLLVTERDAHLMTLLERGERIPEIALFAESGLLVLAGVVRHKWKVEDGFHQRSHILDLEIQVQEEEFVQESNFPSPWAQKTPEKGLSIA